MRLTVSILLSFITIYVFTQDLPAYGQTKRETSGMPSQEATLKVWVTRVRYARILDKGGKDLGKIEFQKPIIVDRSTWDRAMTKWKAGQSEDEAPRVEVQTTCWIRPSFKSDYEVIDGKTLRLKKTVDLCATSDWKSRVGQAEARDYEFLQKRTEQNNMFFEVRLSGSISLAHLTADYDSTVVPGVIRGRIVVDGKPVPGIEVRPYMSYGRDVKPVKTDAEGRFELRQVGPGYNHPNWRRPAGEWKHFFSGGPSGFLPPGGELDLGTFSID